MASKYDPEKDYAKYQDLANEQDDLAKRIADLLEENHKLSQRVEAHLAAARESISPELIKIAAHEFQVEILNEITLAVIESNDLEKAVKLIDHLETHLESRLRLSLRQGEELPRRDATPTLSPAIAAKQRLEAQPQPQVKTQTRDPKVGSPQPQPQPQGQASVSAPPPPPPKGSGNHLVERRTVLNDRVNEICRYEYDGDRLTRMVFFDTTGQPVRTQQMIYDKDGVLVQEIHIDRSGVTLQVFDREVGKDGKIAKEITRNSQNEILHTIEFQYDKKGRLLKKEWHDNNKRRTKSWEYKYDKDGKEPVKIIWHDERNKPYGFVDLRYDDKGHILEEISKDRSGDIIRSLSYQYFYG
jgi:hypothetical protein